MSKTGPQPCGWARFGDTLTDHAAVEALWDDDDPRLQNEALGALLQLTTMCGRNRTDYTVQPGWWRKAIPQLDRITPVREALVRSGLVIAYEVESGVQYRVKSDDPDLINLRTDAERKWTALQRAETENPEWRVEILRRDGDECRWCGRRVKIHDGRSHEKNGEGLKRTFDHLAPGVTAGGPDGLVVACQRCNGRRGREWQRIEKSAGPQDDLDQLRRDFVQRQSLLLRPAPPAHLVWLCDESLAWLAKRGRSAPTPQTPQPSDPPQPEAPDGGDASTMKLPRAAAAARAPERPTRGDVDQADPAAAAAAASPDDSTTDPASDVGPDPTPTLPDPPGTRSSGGATTGRARARDGRGHGAGRVAGSPPGEPATPLTTHPAPPPATTAPGEAEEHPRRRNRRSSRGTRRRRGDEIPA